VKCAEEIENILEAYDVTGSLPPSWRAARITRSHGMAVSGSRPGGAQHGSPAGGADR
jgi:hypothetical protein